MSLSVGAGRGWVTARGKFSSLEFLNRSFLRDISIFYIDKSARSPLVHITTFNPLARLSDVEITRPIWSSLVATSCKIVPGGHFATLNVPDGVAFSVSRIAADSVHPRSNDGVENNLICHLVAPAFPKLVQTINWTFSTRHHPDVDSVGQNWSVS